MTSATDTPLRAEARVRTIKPSGYLQQLCKHFQHKLPATFDARQGRIDFPFGSCALEADPEADILTLQASAGTPEDLSRLEDVIARHLERFAFREEMRIEWRRE
jgi:uncharacterized protein